MKPLQTCCGRPAADDQPSADAMAIAGHTIGFAEGAARLSRTPIVGELYSKVTKPP